MQLADPVKEAERVMVICNACRYCEGHCAVFPAMELRLAFPAPDLRYLANLCHDCGSCFHHCQYAPPHEFDVNVPRVLGELRRETWRRHAWPRALAPLFDRNGLATGIATALSSVLFVAAGLALAGPGALRAQLGPGAFYRVVPHWLMVGLFCLASAWTLLALAAACVRFWREAGDRGRIGVEALGHAAAEAATLRYLDGGGDGCTYPGEEPARGRRRYHHLTSYGFLLCFAATCAAALLEWTGSSAPYPWWSAPVVLGTLGGLGLIAGPAGLLFLEARADQAPHPRSGMDVSFLLLLFLTSATGFLVLFLRATPAMGTLLLLHLGVVMGLFLTVPYGKFVHAFYRCLALVRWAGERSRPHPEAPPEVV